MNRHLELRIRAKRFKKSLGGYARKLPDSLLDSIKDSEINELYRILYGMQVFRIKATGYPLGSWESPEYFSPAEHFQLEEILIPEPEE